MDLAWMNHISRHGWTGPKRLIPCYIARLSNHQTPIFTNNIGSILFSHFPINSFQVVPLIYTHQFTVVNYPTNLYVLGIWEEIGAQGGNLLGLGVYKLHTGSTRTEHGSMALWRSNSARCVSLTDTRVATEVSICSPLQWIPHLCSPILLDTCDRDTGNKGIPINHCQAFWCLTFSHLTMKFLLLL